MILTWYIHVYLILDVNTDLYEHMYLCLYAHNQIIYVPKQCIKYTQDTKKVIYFIKIIIRYQYLMDKIFIK